MALIKVKIPPFCTGQAYDQLCYVTVFVNNRCSLAEWESNQVGFDVQICPIPSSFPLDILPICPAGKAFGLEKICCVKTACTRQRMNF